MMPQANISNNSTASSTSSPRSSSPTPSASSSSNFSVQVQHDQPLSMRLSMPFRSAFSRHGDLRSKLFNEDLMDNFFSTDRPFRSFSHNRDPFSIDIDQVANDLFSSFDNRPGITSNSSNQQFPNREASPGQMINSRRYFSSTSSLQNDNNKGGLEETIHHIIHTEEEPSELEQRVKIFIAQDRARGLGDSSGNGNGNSVNTQQFPRISARLPRGGSLTFSFSSDGTNMQINDGSDFSQVPPHPLLSIEQKKQLKERLLAQKNDMISGPNTSATILTSDSSPYLNGNVPARPGVVNDQRSPGSVADRVMWFEGFPQLQITHHPAGRLHRSAAHIAMQNWKNMNPDFLDFSRPPYFANMAPSLDRQRSGSSPSVEREIPIIREGEFPEPNRNAISITLEVPPNKQTSTTSPRVSQVETLVPSKPGNLSSIPAPEPQKATILNKPTSRTIDVKPVERIIPTILPSPEPKPVEKTWFRPSEKTVDEPEIRPAVFKQFEAKEKDVRAREPKSPEIEKASETISRALQRGMKREEAAKTSPLVQAIKVAAESKTEVQLPEPRKLETPTPNEISKRASPPKVATPPSRSPPVVASPLAKNIPPFHYPRGKPKKNGNDSGLMDKVRKAFNGKAELKLDEMKDVMASLDLPLYWRRPLFLAAAGSDATKETISFEKIWNTWKTITANCYDDASRFTFLLAREGRNYLLPDDFVPMVQDVVDTHPGLNILKEAPEFHARYINTVIARIYYNVNRSWTGRITIEELRRSNFLQVLATVNKEEDINVVTEYFSYEHFYVIYCKFWELDRDHDLLIDKSDLARHNDHAISLKMIDRIFSGAVTRGPNQKNGKMSYSEFVWFLIAEEDKRRPTSIEYWFRCMDIDGDGVLSLFELEYFYDEQLQRMKSLGIEALPFQDIACQMLDMVHPKHKDRILLTDLKRCRMTPLFFDTFFNIEKYLLHEHRDPFASAKVDADDSTPISDWDRYAAEEYELLVSEDAASEDL
ncbi:hypothetical protein RvY_15989 [Ramazzottius varieornatus]|uniref:EF-hand domain-containing protein n=1 Tax=Ramazzottius varieornatus TaxID=947166 RepID=A0A1D1W1E9_RAMVA|nr:hypothetical protein RvY_15989 [Ramazzottius varieornatus]